MLPLVRVGAAASDLLLLMYFFYIYCGSTVLNLCGGHAYQCIHYFGCKRAVNSAIFPLILHIFTGAVGKKGKNNHSIYPTDTFLKTHCLLLSMFDMYRSLALLYM